MESIEELIKQRIRDELWDDVVRREQTVGGDRSTTSMPEISKEKSKAGLGEIYEQEYREQVMGEVKEDEMDKEELEIQEVCMLCACAVLRACCRCGLACATV